MKTKETKPKPEKTRKNKTNPLRVRKPREAGVNAKIAKFLCLTPETVRNAQKGLAIPLTTWAVSQCLKQLSMGKPMSLNLEKATDNEVNKFLDQKEVDKVVEKMSAQMKKIKKANLLDSMK